MMKKKNFEKLVDEPLKVLSESDFEFEKTEALLRLIGRLGFDPYNLTLYLNCIQYVEEFCSESDTDENREKIAKIIKEYQNQIFDDINEQYLKILDELEIWDDSKDVL